MPTLVGYSSRHILKQPCSFEAPQNCGIWLEVWISMKQDWACREYREVKHILSPDEIIKGDSWSSLC